MAAPKAQIPARSSERIDSIASDQDPQPADALRPEACEIPPTPSIDDEAWHRAIEKRRCLHCEGDLGSGWRTDEGPFCCRGCQAVFELIRGSGLTRYYDLRRGPQAPAPSLRSASLSWLDRLLEQEGLSDAQRPYRLSLDIQGVHCAACIWLLEELFRREAGGLDLKINPTLGKVDLVWDPAGGDLRHYLSEAEKFGYRLGPSRKGGARGSRDLLFRMAVSIAIALNVMMFSISYYLGLAPIDGPLFDLFGALSLVLATVSVAVGGQVFFRRALAGLRRRMAHLDLPISVGIGLAYGGSVIAYLTRGPLAAYFDSLTVFVALMLVGRWAQEHVLERNRNTLLETSGAERLVARRRRGDVLEAVSAPAIALGDELWIAPGDLLPVRGTLLRREARAALDWITGESDLVGFEPGDEVPAGAFNAGDRGFAVSAVEGFGDSRLNDLLRSESSDARQYRPSWWTRVATGYVLGVLLLAALGFLFWARIDLLRGIEVTVAILVVTCPCALGLASPLAQELLHHALRRRGVFLRRGDLLDRALEVRKVLLDKTGTLTLGHLELTPESVADLERLEASYRSILRNLVARSNHPVSQALLAALRSTGGSAHDGGREALERGSEAVRELAGRGLEWQREGRIFRLGRADFGLFGAAPRSNRGSRAPALPAGEAAATTFTVDGEVLAGFHFAEVFKADAASELERLRHEGFEIHLLSGDAPARVERARQVLGIEAGRAYGGLDPGQKAALVRQLDESDTLMVGDGLNDSPSFEAAYCTATPAVDRPVLPGKADFYFLGDGISALRRTLGGARRLRRVIRDNLAVAVVYNLGAVAFCLAGLVSPLVAAILMPASSIAIVSWTAFRLSGRRLAWMS